MNPAGLALLLVAAFPLHPFAHQVLDDGRDLATAPLRWHGREWRRFAESIYPKIRGAMVPQDMFDQARQRVSEYQAAHK